MKNIFQKISRHYGLFAVLALPMITAFFYALTMPVSFDEAATFLLFTNKGLTETVSHYPAPNNHILHSVITHFTEYLPFSSELFRMRISVMVVHLATLIVLYRFVLAYFGKKTALAAVAISAMLFLNIYYSYMSRGYALVNFFFVCSLYCSYNLIHQKKPIHNWLWFSFFSILGFYTMPSYLYPFLTLNGLILTSQPKYFWRQLAFGFLVVFIVFLLYLPILFHDGLGAITNNPYVKPIGFWHTVKSLPLFYLHAMEEIVGIHWLAPLLLLSVAVYLILKSSDKINRPFAILFCLAPIILLSLHQVVPFARVFNYYSFIIVLLILIPFCDKLETTNLKVLLACLLVLQSVLWFNFDSKIYAYENKDQALNITASQLIPKIIGDKKYLFNHSLLSYNLEFELITKGYKNYHIREISYQQISADSIADFDFVIINNEADATKLKQPIFTTAYYRLYKN